MDGEKGKLTGAGFPGMLPGEMNLFLGLLLM